MTARRYDPNEIIRRYVVEGEGVVAIARELGTRPSYILRLLLGWGVYERHRPSLSEWARAHAVGAVPDVPGVPVDELPTAPARATAPPPDRDPLVAYLARLAPASRRERQRALETIATLASAGRADAASLDWEWLGPAHAAMVRAGLVGRYAPSTVNRHLSVLRGVLWECRRLGLLDPKAYERVAGIASVARLGRPRPA